MIVAKFGGTSVADAQRIRRVIDIVRSDPRRQIVVVSAPGKRSKSDIKVTDMLIACGQAMLKRGEAEAEIAAIIQRFEEIVRDLEVSAGVMERIRNDLRERLSADRRQEQLYLDAIKAAGEDYCAQIVAEAFVRSGCPATYVSPRQAGLILSDEPGNARVLEESYSNLAALRNYDRVVVFPGFFGVTRSGQIVTFPRGGSDITGAILAAAVKAEEYENFTDVDSVFAADPNIIPDAQPIRMLTYRELRELSYAGFGVFHDEAVIPAVRAGIPIHIRNTMKPEAEGTRVVPERPYTPGAVVGIASSDGFCTFYVSKYLMNREIGFGRRLLQIFEEEGLSYEHAPSGIDNMSVILREAQLTPEKEERLLQRIRTELEADDVEFEKGLALIMVVGEGMRYTVGLASRATTALARAGVNIEMMNQGSSEISMMFGVKEVDRRKAVRALYREFFGG